MLRQTLSNQIVDLKKKLDDVSQEELYWTNQLKSALSKLPGITASLYRGATFGDNQVAQMKEGEFFLDNGFTRDSQKPFVSAQGVNRHAPQHNCHFYIESTTGKDIKSMRPKSTETKKKSSLFLVLCSRSFELK